MGNRAEYNREGHGSEARARRHYRDGEKPCTACLEAAARAQDARRQLKKEQREP
jgi:hypothetical protein